MLMLKDGLLLEFRSEMIDKIKNEPGKYLELAKNINDEPAENIKEMKHLAGKRLKVDEEEK